MNRPSWASAAARPALSRTESSDVDVLFPFAEYWWMYGLFTAFILVLLAVDLGVFHRHAHAVTFRESLAWSAVWVTLALAFNYGLFAYAAGRFGPEAGERLGLEFLTGFLVEKSLAVDNIFVFVLVFAYFRIPLQYQHRVLFYGILGALVLRGVFIALGSVLMQYHAVVLIFGVFLVLTGLKMLRAPEQQVDPDRNAVIRLFRRWIPVTRELHGARFLVRHDGRLQATPLLVALVFLEMSDVIFAVDSVPAIFAISREPFIVFTSNVFAILGLRAMYFLLAGAIERFHLLKYGLALVLIFVGLKMVWLNDAFGGKFPIEWSLAIIATLLLAAILASLVVRRPRAGTATDSSIDSQPV
ncbi:MAG TPA: TerC family protein [Vicinamibacterales bacterium]|nr:TerC family protein [Vicinamibacterales bacterium]